MTVNDVITVGELSALTGVPPSTIKADLKRLAAGGRINETARKAGGTWLLLKIFWLAYYHENLTLQKDHHKND